MKAAIENNDVVKVSQIIESGSEISHFITGGKTPLMYACEMGNIDIVRLLLPITKSYIDEKDCSGKTALMFALESGSIEIVKLLIIAIGEKSEILDEEYIFDLEEDGSEIIQDVLVSNGLDIAVKDRYGKTLLMHSAIGGNVEIVKILLDTPYININAQDDFGSTALTFALEGGHMKVVKELLDSPEIDLSLQEDNGSTALTVSSARGYVHTVHLLEKKINGKTREPYIKLLENNIMRMHINVLKYLMYTGSLICGLGNAELDYEDALERLKFLSRKITNKVKDTESSIFLTKINSTLHAMPKAMGSAEYFDARPPHRIALLAARVYGVVFKDSVTVFHSDMNISKFKLISDLMRAVKVSSLMYDICHDVGTYFFIRALLLRKYSKSLFENIYAKTNMNIITMLIGDGAEYIEKHIVDAEKSAISFRSMQSLAPLSIKNSSEKATGLHF